jgi:hypothetical protein
VKRTIGSVDLLSVAHVVVVLLMLPQFVRDWPLH